MRHQDGVEIFRLLLDGRHARQDVAFAQAGVHENGGALGADEGGVSRAAAGKDTNLDDDAPPVL